MTVTTGGPASTLRRRSLLIGGLGAGVAAIAGAGWLVDEGVLPGRSILEEALGYAGSAGDVPNVQPGPLLRGSFDSAARRRRVHWAVALPPGTDPERPRSPSGGRLPVCVVLHGRGDSAAAMISLGYPQFLAAAVGKGLAPFALASIDGGETYWHARADGDDPATMVLAEYLPLLAAGHDLAARPTDRIAFLGWSMGAYGALLLGARLGPARVSGIAAESPALWLHAADSAAGAFDDAADFHRNDVFTRIPALAAIPIRIDCGRADPFYPAATAFAKRLPTGTPTDFGNGAHNTGYWRAKAPKAISFVGNALVR